jgi:hypothetical protein
LWLLSEDCKFTQGGFAAIFGADARDGIPPPSIVSANQGTSSPMSGSHYLQKFLTTDNTESTDEEDAGSRRVAGFHLELFGLLAGRRAADVLSPFTLKRL